MHATRYLLSKDLHAYTQGSSPRLQIVALDFAEEMLQYAERRQRERQQPGSRGLPDIEWVLGDATRLPFPDASFDAATMGYGLRNVRTSCQQKLEMSRCQLQLLLQTILCSQA